MKRLKCLLVVLVVVLLAGAALVWKGLIWVIAGMLSMFGILFTWLYIMTNDNEFLDDLF